jgi:glutamine amidotransferase-like uncharacterized protein
MTRFFTIAIAAAALVGALSVPASAKPQNGNHHHHYWNGGGIYIVGNTYDEPECYMATKYNHYTGKPYLVEVCS